MASEFQTLARPYASAAFEFALEQQAIEQWESYLQTATAISAEEQFALILDDPKVSAMQCAQIMIAIAKESFSKEFGNFILQLAQNNRLVILPVITELFADAHAEYLQKIAVDVISAMTLTTDQQQRLQQALSKRLQRTVDITYQIDTDLMGGMVVRAGDWVMDGSAKSQLEKLNQQLIA